MVIPSREKDKREFKPVTEGSLGTSGFDNQPSQPLRDKIVQIVTGMEGSGCDTGFRVFGLSETGKVYEWCNDGWDLSVDSPLLPVAEEK